MARATAPRGARGKSMLVAGKQAMRVRTIAPRRAPSMVGVGKRAVLVRGHPVETEVRARALATEGRALCLVLQLQVQ